MKLNNSTLYNYRATIDNKEYELKGRTTIEFDCTENTKVELINLNKSSVHMDWLQIILLQMLFGSTTLTKIYIISAQNTTIQNTITIEYRLIASTYAFKLCSSLLFHTKNTNVSIIINGNIIVNDSFVMVHSSAEIIPKTIHFFLSDITCI